MSSQSSSPVYVKHPRGMRVPRPTLHCIVRAGRRLQADARAVPTARALSGRGVVCTPQAEVGPNIAVCFTAAGRKRKPTLGPSLTDVPKGGPLQAYAKLVLKGSIREDAHQVKMLHLLQNVRLLRKYEKCNGSTAVPVERQVVLIPQFLFFAAPCRGLISNQSGHRFAHSTWL